MCSMIHLNSDVGWCLTCNTPFNVHTHTPEMHLEASLRLTVLLKHTWTPDPTETTHLPPELQPLMERNPSSGWRPFLRGINLNLQTVLVFPRRQHRNVPVSKHVTVKLSGPFLISGKNCWEPEWWGYCLPVCELEGSCGRTMSCTGKEQVPLY